MSSSSAAAAAPADVLVNILENLVGSRVMNELCGDEEKENVDRVGGMSTIDDELKSLIKRLRMENAEQRDGKKRRMMDEDEDEDDDEDDDEDEDDSEEEEDSEESESSSESESEEEEEED